MPERRACTRKKEFLTETPLYLKNLIHDRATFVFPSISFPVLLMICFPFVSTGPSPFLSSHKLHVTALPLESHVWCIPHTHTYLVGISPFYPSHVSLILSPAKSRGRSSSPHNCLILLCTLAPSRVVAHSKYLLN